MPGGLTRPSYAAQLSGIETWLAETLHSHVAHPVLVYYRAQRWGTNWVVSLALMLDICAS